MNGIPLNGFLSHTHFARDTHDFIRSWTQLNLGEPTVVLGSVLNPAVDAFSNFMMRKAGFLEDLGVDLPVEGDSLDEQNFNGTTAVLLMYVDVSERK